MRQLHGCHDLRSVLRQDESVLTLELPTIGWVFELGAKPISADLKLAEDRNGSAENNAIAFGCEATFVPVERLKVGEVGVLISLLLARLLDARPQDEGVPRHEVGRVPAVSRDDLRARP